jgi:hypothetical protein
MEKEIKELEEKLKDLKKQETLEENRKSIPFADLAEIGQSLKVSDEAMLKYEQLFTDFALNKINQIEERKNLKKKKFVIKIGWE